MSSQGNRIKELRKCLGLTQEKFAAQIGIKRNSLSQIEIGTNSLSPQNMLLICREWNVSEEWLREGTGEMFISADRRQQLHAWADRVLADSPESFRYRFVNALSRLPEEWWALTEQAALEILAEYNPEQAEKIKAASAAADADPEEAATRRTYEVGTNFGAVGDGAVVIKND